MLGRILATAVACGSLVVPALARAQAPATATLSAADAQFIKMAEAGAPAAISAKAAVVRVDTAKKTMTQLRAGTNGFTCTLIPDGSDDPICADQNATLW